MKDRCRQNYRHAKLYYSQATFDPRWLSFDAFVEDMGERPDGYTLDKIDNALPYSKDNCRWLTNKEQQNNRTDNRLLLWNDNVYTLRQLHEVCGIPYTTLKMRLNAGWSVNDAATIPVHGRKTTKRKQKKND